MSDFEQKKQKYPKSFLRILQKKHGGYFNMIMILAKEDPKFQPYPYIFGPVEDAEIIEPKKEK